jgi:hypothetical protein
MRGGMWSKERWGWGWGGGQPLVSVSDKGAGEVGGGETIFHFDTFLHTFSALLQPFCKLYWINVSIYFLPNPTTILHTAK